MKALIYKELKLAMHPICYVFIVAFPFMILIPSYPIAIGFIYVLTCYPILFLGANKGQQSNDLLYSTLLPVRKKDIVLARIFTVILMQLGFILVMSALYPLAVIFNGMMNESIEAARAAGESVSDVTIPGLGLNSYILILGIAIIGFALADLIFFPIYYKRGKSIVMSTILTILGFALYICTMTIAVPYIPGLDVLNNLHIGIQFGILAFAMVVSAVIHFFVYKISARRLERVDF